jgi:hypothetical protein
MQRDFSEETRIVEPAAAAQQIFASTGRFLHAGPLIRATVPRTKRCASPDRSAKPRGATQQAVPAKPQGPLVCVKHVHPRRQAPRI